MASTIKVNTIQAATNTATTIKTHGGTTAMTVDSTGRVLTPNAVAWMVNKTSTQTTSGANEVVTWQGVTLNQGGGFQTSGSNVNKFVAPVHGIYQCNATMLTPDDSTNHDIGLYVNSTIFVRTRNGTGGSHESYSLSWVGEMNANDTLYLAIIGSGNKLYGDASTNGYWTTWCGFLIG